MDRVNKTVKLTVATAISIMTCGLIVFQLFPSTLLGFFNASPEMLEIGDRALRIISIHFPLAGFGIIAGSVCQAIGNPFYSLIISVCRQLVVLLPVAWLLALIYSVEYMSHSQNEARFYVFLFLSEGMLLGTALSADFVSMYVFYELTSLCSMPLVLHELTHDAVTGAMKYLYYSIGGAFFVLFGIVVLYTNTSTLDFAPGGTLIAGQHTGLELLAVFFVVLGFGTKAGLFPMHNWLPSAHPVAPAPASALLSGIITKAGVIGIIRVLYFIAGPSALRGTWVQTACLVLALGTVFIGSMLAYGERDFKKRLAYSSISQISYVLTALFLLFQAPLLRLFGASADTLPYAMQYLNLYVLGTVFVMTSLGLNGFITAQGRSSVAMKTVVIGAVLNTVLDPLFIFVLKNGRARRGCGDNSLAGGVCGMGSAVSDRKADGSALKTRVFPHRPTGSGVRSRSGRVPICHAVNRKPAHHRVQRIAAKVRRRRSRRRNDHPDLGGANGAAAADRTRAGRAAHTQLRLRREAARPA